MRRLYLDLLTEMDDPAFEIATDTAVQSLKLAASQHDVPALRDLLRHTSADVTDPETGSTPLHAAVAALDASDANVGNAANDNVYINGHGDNGQAQRDVETEDIQTALQAVKLLLQRGAHWDAVDGNDETPGCIALRLGQKEVYGALVDAGVRAELVNIEMGEYQPLADREDGLDNGSLQDPDAGPASSMKSKITSPAEADRPPGLQRDHMEALLHDAAGLIQTSVTRPGGGGLHILTVGPPTMNVMLARHFHSPLINHIDEEKFLDSIQRYSYFKDDSPKHDLILWYVSQGNYARVKRFFNDEILEVLPTWGKFMFLNANVPNRRIFYDVYSQLVEMDLLDADMDFERFTIPISTPEHAPHWALRSCTLPLCYEYGAGA